MGRAQCVSGQRSRSATTPLAVAHPQQFELICAPRNRTTHGVSRRNRFHCACALSSHMRRTHSLGIQRSLEYQYPWEPDARAPLAAAHPQQFEFTRTPRNRTMHSTSRLNSFCAYALSSHTRRTHSLSPQPSRKYQYPSEPPPRVPAPAVRPQANQFSPPQPHAEYVIRRAPWSSESSVCSWLMASARNRTRNRGTIMHSC